MITAKEKAKELYDNCYARYCHELSRDKNKSQAKAIALYICSEVNGYMGADRGYLFWENVKDRIKEI